MEIAIVTEEFRPSNKGGIASWAFELAEYLGRHHEFNVNIFVKKKGGVINSIIDKKLNYKINLIGGRDWSKFKKWFIRLGLRKYLKSKKNPVIISSNWELSEGLISFKDKYSFCLITVLHGLEVTRLESIKYSKRIKNFNLTISNSNHVIAVSDYTKNKAELISGNSLIETIPNFVDPEKFFLLNQKESREQFGFKESDKILLTLSRLVKRKGHEIVINALSLIVKTIPNIKYVIAGSGEKRYEEDLKRLVSRLELDNNVLFLGYIEEEKKNDLYNACDIYIMNSHKTNDQGDSEGFGITFLESNACGKPIIGTEVGGIPDAISNYENGLLIEPNNPSRTAAAILELFNNHDLYNRLSINGLSRIEKNFSIKKVGKKYIKIISDYYDF